MFASISVLDNLDMETYEWYGTHLHGYFNKHPEQSPFSHKTSDSMHYAADGKSGFSGIVFRKKPAGGTTND